MSPSRRSARIGSWSMARRRAAAWLGALLPGASRPGTRQRPSADPYRRQAERTAAALAAEQAALVRERESLARLIELDRHKTEFISSISHELRTPLTSISGYLELLLDGEAGTMTDQQRLMLTIVDRNSRRLLELLDGLLTLSRLESGTLSLRVEAVDVATLLHRVQGAAAPALAARSLSLLVSVDSDLGSVPGDAGELERALENVLTNAIKFSHPGGSITLAAGSNGDRMVITVADAGIGIPYADQGKLFTRFFRSGSAAEQAIQGTGLGLVIVKGIIDSHAGTVEVASVPGQGTVVTVSLPRGNPAGDAGAPSVPAQAVGQR